MKEKLTLSSGIEETDTHHRCKQAQCGFYVNGGCKACSKCKSGPFIIKKACERCYECENLPGRVRWNDPELEKEMEKALKEQTEDAGKIIGDIILDAMQKAINSNKSEKNDEKPDFQFKKMKR